MSKMFTGSLSGEPIEFGGQSSPGHPRRAKSVPDIVQRKFGAVAKVLWRKPAAEIAYIANVNVRTAKRILRGESDIPLIVMLAAIHEMVREQD